MIKHLALYFIAAFALHHFFDFSFFQVMVICLLIGIYNMIYEILNNVVFLDMTEGD